MNSENSFDPGKMTQEQAADYLGMTEGTLANLRSDPKGPDYFKLGRIFYKQADLDIYIESRRTKSGPKA